MPQRTKIEALRIIMDCAIQYKANLEGMNVMFVTTKGNSEAADFETLYMAHNFKHLTGITSSLNAELFYRAAVNQRLSERDITLASDKATDMKLDILPTLMNIHTVARMVGDYDDTRPLLVADKFAGTVAVAMGFLLVNGVYIPNTAMKKDVREITAKASRRRVVAILSKPRTESLYGQLTYIAKGMAVDGSMLSPVFREKVDIDNLTADFPIPRMPVEDGTQ